MRQSHKDDACHCFNVGQAHSFHNQFAQSVAIHEKFHATSGSWMKITAHIFGIKGKLTMFNFPILLLMVFDPLGKEAKTQVAQAAFTM